MKRNKMKYIAIIIVFIIVAVISAYMYMFTEVFGTPKYIYLPCSSDMDSDGGFVRPEEVKEMHVYYKKKLAFVSHFLKYCKNLEYFTFTADPDDGAIKNLDFLAGHDKLKTLCINGNIKDWSGISECKNVSYIRIGSLSFSGNTNFSELKLFNNLTELKEIIIETNMPLDYSGTVTLDPLESFTYNGPKFDFSALKSAEKIDSIIVKSDIVSNYDELLDKQHIEFIRIIDPYISNDTLEIISKLKHLKTLQLYCCKFEVSEDEVMNMLDGLSTGGTEVSFNSCTFK